MLATIIAQRVSAFTWVVDLALMTPAWRRYQRGRPLGGDVTGAILWYVSFLIAYFSLSSIYWSTIAVLPPLALAIRLVGYLLSAFIAALALRIQRIKATVG